MAFHLYKDEEAWRSPLEKLQERFPETRPEQVLQALRDAKGHAGRAAAALRTSIVACEFGRSIPQMPPARSVDDEVARLRAELHEERCHRQTAEQVAAQARAELIASRAAQAEAETVREMNVTGSGGLVDASAREGRRLRKELDAAIAETRAERAKVRQLHAEATVASSTSSRLLKELEASRSEGMRLRRELEIALEAGASDDVVRGRRDKLCREIEGSLHESAEVARHTDATEPKCEAREIGMSLDATAFHIFFT